MLQAKNIKLQDKPFLKSATIYTDSEVKLRACVLYFHGGGLLYGNREDLPELHRGLFTQAGYAIISFDYPLAPAAQIDQILEDVCKSIETYLNQIIPGVPANLPYFLWGRSAGAYLCLLSAAKGTFSKNPWGIISYYGYGFLCDNWFKCPSPFYLRMPAVPKSFLESLPLETHSFGPMDTHYSAYVYARQKGTWTSFFYRGRDSQFLMNYSLRCVDTFPCPLFCAHSINDPDVPYDEFLNLCSKYNTKRYISASTGHDFDRTDSPFSVTQLLNSTIQFLNNRLQDT